MPRKQAKLKRGSNYLVMADNKRRRISIEIPLVKEIRLFLWAQARGLTKTEMAERIVIDRVSNPDNWDEAVKDLKQEAAIAQMPLSQYVATLLKSEFELPTEDIDWTPLLQSSEQTLIDEIIAALEEAPETTSLPEAIAMIKNMRKGI